MAGEGNRSTWEYYDLRSLQRPPGVGNAVAYWQGLGVPCTSDDVAAEAARVEAELRALPPGRSLDVGCGPGTFTGFIGEEVVAIDQSHNAVVKARERFPSTPVLRGDAMSLPFATGSFDVALVSHLYGLLVPGEALDLMDEASRVASEVVIVDAGRPAGVAAEEIQERDLPDGSHHQVFRRHFEADGLAHEVGGRVVFGGSFYVVVAVTGAPRRP